jgi:putative PIN family toxin of toxin-antitoxin system
MIAENNVVLLRGHALAILTGLTAVAGLVNLSRTLKVVPEDPADNRILECAVEAKANYIVTEDPHLLKLSSYRDVEIVNAVAFLEKLTP